MQVERSFLYPYHLFLPFDPQRRGVWICLLTREGRKGWGDIAPLSAWSQESYEEVFAQLHAKQAEIQEKDWTIDNYAQQLEELSLYPSASFGLESALLSLLSPSPFFSVPASALFMGTKEEIIAQAKKRKAEGYTFAKLKVNNLSFQEAHFLIETLKKQFRLRIDVNRAWKTEESLRFFSQFPIETFDYVEEPFENPADLIHFSHPLAVDESFPNHFSLDQLSSLPTLKALIFKPTIQGGLKGCKPILRWAQEHEISLVFSSCFESDLGHWQIASLAFRLFRNPLPIGLGTYHHILNPLLKTPLVFSKGRLSTGGDEYLTEAIDEDRILCLSH